MWKTHQMSFYGLGVDFKVALMLMHSGTLFGVIRDFQSFLLYLAWQDQAVHVRCWVPREDLALLARKCGPRNFQQWRCPWRQNEWSLLKFERFLRTKFEVALVWIEAMLALSVRADDREPETGSLQNWLKYAGIMRYSAVTVSAWKFADQDQFVHQDKFLIPSHFFWGQPPFNMVEAADHLVHLAHGTVERGEPLPLDRTVWYCL